MGEAFSRTLRGAPYKGERYRNSKMDATVQDILRERGLAFTRGTLETHRIIRSISRLATGAGAAAPTTRPKQITVTREMVIEITIEIAKACKAIYGRSQVLFGTSLHRIAGGLAVILRNEGGYPVQWHDEAPINWENELTGYDRQHSSKK